MVVFEYTYHGNGISSNGSARMDIINATEEFRYLSTTSLKNLFSGSESPFPPHSPDDIASWSSAAEALSNTHDKRLLITLEQATLSSHKSIRILDDMLSPIFKATPLPTAMLHSLEDLPPPAAIHAVSALLAQTALACDPSSKTLTSAIDCLLRAAEHATALALDLSDHRLPLRYSLFLALSTALNLKPLLESFSEGAQSMQDIVARLQVLLMASSRLTETEHKNHAINTPPPTSTTAYDVWRWNLHQPLDAHLPIQTTPALSLTRVYTEITAVLLSTAWDEQIAEVKGTFIPLTMLAAEKEAVLLLLGRVLSLIKGEETAARLLIPVVADTLAAKVGDLEAGVYGVAAHVLASMAATCAVDNSSWGYTQVVDVLIKLYKFPQFAISSALMHGVPSTTEASSSAQPSPYNSHRNSIQGRCPGALANALHHLAANIGRSQLRYKKDFRQRLLCLFSDFSLLLPNETFAKDLGSLLPAIAAVMQHGTDLKSSGRLSSSLSAADLSLEDLSLLQEENRALHAALRHLWLQSSVYNFASVSKGGGSASDEAIWPLHWSLALSHIAAKTPVLLLGSEQQKAEAFHEHISSEYTSWLAKLGARGDASRLSQQLTGILGTHLALQQPWQLTPSILAHVLTIAYKAVCHAAFQCKEVPVAPSPLASVVVHMQYSTSDAVEYSLLKKTLVAAFNSHVCRLAMLSSHESTESKSISTTGYPAQASEETSQVLIDALVLPGPNTDVPATCAMLLEKLVERFPSLLFSEKTLGAVLEAVGKMEAHAASPPPTTISSSSHVAAPHLQRDQMTISFDADSGSVHALAPANASTTATMGSSLGVNTSPAAPTADIARSYMFFLIKRAASISPAVTEAIVIERIRHLASLGSAYAGAAVKFAPDVMQAIQMGRETCPLPELSGAYKGLLSWSMKIHATGLVSGTAEVQEDSDIDIVSIIGRRLYKGMQSGTPTRDLISKMVDTAAAIITYEGSSAVPPLLTLLAWTPVSRFVPDVMRASIMTWHWLLARCSNRRFHALLKEILQAWQASKDQNLGVFQQKSSLSEGNTASSASKDLSSSILDALHCHHAWIVFFTEVWRSRRPGIGSTFESIFARVVASSIGYYDDEALSVHLAACAPRFRMLHLALEFVCCCFGTHRDRMPGGLEDPVEVYRKIVQTALRWFGEDVAWYQGQNSTEDAREAALAVQGFAALLSRAPSLLQQRDSSDAASTRLKETMYAPETIVLQDLLAIEIERLFLWSNPINHRATPAAPAAKAPSLQQHASLLQWTGMVSTSWALSPSLALALGSRFAGVPAVRAELQRLVTLHAANPAVQQYPLAVQYVATPTATTSNAPELSYLERWAPMTLGQAISLMATPAGRHPSVISYLLRSMAACDPEESAFFLPQLVQLLRHDPHGKVEEFLLHTAEKSTYFAYLLVCQLASEGRPPDEAFSPVVKRSNWTPPVDTGMWSIADEVQKRFWQLLRGPVREHLTAELNFFHDVTEVSGKLYPIPKEERKAAAVRLMKDVTLPRDDLFMPTDSTAVITGIKPETAAPMQSAAKCPILVAFDVQMHQKRDSLHHDGTGSRPQYEESITSAVSAAIFKVGDDCRQDVLALQVVSLLKRKFDQVGLPLPLIPYAVVPTGHECGIIQVVPHAKSRAQLGELTDGGLFEVFQYEFGLPGSKRFESARSAFIASCAAYAVASYLLQAKDRHNGNIMIDNRGCIIHIDFGYILGISPGGNMGFESAAFKLSYEMTELLDPGNTRASPHFLKFQELCIKGYLTARSIAEDIVATVAMMVPSQLPCFSRGNPIESLRERFHLEMSDAEAATFMKGLIADAYDKWTTGVYDLIQYYQNAIPK